MSVALVVVSQVAAAEPSTGPTKLDQLSWLAGYWEGAEDGVLSEEVWLEARGGLMLGQHRDSRQGSRAFFEFLRIEEHPDGLVYLASPKGRAATEFRSVEQSDRRVVFQNPDHDYPQEISYQLDEKGMLHVRIAGMDDSQPVREWIWERRNDFGAATR